jgi:hypothetical protein
VSPRSGDKTQKAYDYTCSHCREVIHVSERATIPTCKCGGTFFEEPAMARELKFAAK